MGQTKRIDGKFGDFGEEIERLTYFAFGVKNGKGRGRGTKEKGKGKHKRGERKGREIKGKNQGFSGARECGND